MKRNRIRPAVWLGSIFRAVVPWYLLFVIGRVILDHPWSPLEEASPLPRLLWLIIQDSALLLPFLLFPAGLAMGRVLGHSRRAFRSAALVAIPVSTLSYVLGAWAAPEIEDLRWDLHQPLALAVFGIANVFLAMLASELTVDLSRGVRRNVRLAIGVGGGVLFVACVVLTSPTEAFLRDATTMRSGIASAWVPLVIPVIEGLILRRLVTNRRYG